MIRYKILRALVKIRRFFGFILFWSGMLFFLLIYAIFWPLEKIKIIKVDHNALFWEGKADSKEEMFKGLYERRRKKIEKAKKKRMRTNE